jgi:threonine dehydrogenase-like Zn-dependent dehydrogenase
VGRAVAFTATGRAEVVEVEDGAVAPGEVAGSTLVSLVSPGTELASYSADGPHPQFPGYAAVFRIEETGEGVEGLSAGQLAYCMGDHRSRQIQPAEMVLALPEGLDPAVAVFARLAGVSMTTLVTTKARPPDPVLVSGLGPVGNLAAQVFQSAGYTVFAHDPVAERARIAIDAGIDHVFTELVADAIPAPALVVDCSGHEQAILQGCQLVQKGGEVVLVGVPWRPRSNVTAHELIDAIFQRYVLLRSGWEWELPLHPEPWRTGSIFGNQSQALAWLADGRLRANGLSVPVAPDRAQQAYQDLLAQQGPLTRTFSWS